MMILDRRKFIGLGLGSTSLWAHKGFGSERFLTIQPTDRLSFKAYRSTHDELEHEIVDIEGVIPQEISGRYLKVGPGTKDIFNRSLNHFFDGDAYLCSLFFDQTNPQIKTQFLNTPQRIQEQSAGKMLFHEFGTEAPTKKFGRKNQPNINVLPWDESYLMLSEGGHPARINKTSLEFEGYHNFEGSLPDDVSFSAHPKMDPKTGEIFAFGIHQGLSRALKVFRLDPETKKVKELYSLNQNHVFMIHDMAITSDYLVFLIPPVTFKLSDLILKKEPLASAVRFNPKMGSRLIILDRQGKKKPIEIELPSYMVFHHAGAFSDGKVLKIYSMLAQDGSILASISNWHSDMDPNTQLPSLHEVIVDLNQMKVTSITPLIKDCDFPIMSSLDLHLPPQFVYLAGMRRKADPFAFNEIIKYDLEKKSEISYQMPNHQVCSEPCFISKPHGAFEDDGYLLYQGLDEKRDETFFDILDARSLNRIGRLWCGHYIPLGFHGMYRP